MLAAKLLMSCQAVSADAQDLGVKLFKTLEICLKSLHLPGSAGGEIGEVEGQHDVSFPQIFRQQDGPLG